MPVPSSYNDITSNNTIRDYLGWVWYQTEDIIDVEDWRNSRVVLHFGGIHYYTNVVTTRFNLVGIRYSKL